MCLICIDYKKGLLTNDEIIRNVNEMYPNEDDPHVNEIVDMLIMDAIHLAFKE